MLKTSSFIDSSAMNANVNCRLQMRQETKGAANCTHVRTWKNVEDK